jgi:hypothetical protein
VRDAIISSPTRAITGICPNCDRIAIMCDCGNPEPSSIEVQMNVNLSKVEIMSVLENLNPTAETLS